jgi:hypothetical protein
MRLHVGTGPAIGIAALAVVAVAVPVAVARQGHASVPTVRVAPLTATDREVLSRGRPLIEALPAAIAEVPAAVSDAAGHRVTAAQAETLLAGIPALAPLTRALANPSTSTGRLLAGYHAVLAGRPVPAADQLAGSLESLQTIEGDIGPAVRVVSARSGHPLSAAAALTAVESDAHEAALANVVADWQQIYGSFTLVEQYAAS